ncbi:MAG: hypothetical protein LBP71_02765 [Spirochaetaceae bacterium]|jgi:hypothetical protein|nr:hypothetical protein [Spirochaetaceae bacterium]
MASFFASLRVNMATTRADFYPPLLFSLLQSWKKNNSFPKKIPKFPQNSRDIRKKREPPRCTEGHEGKRGFFLSGRLGGFSSSLFIGRV